MSESQSNMKVFKTATCKSTSGKSTLTYQIGALPDSTVYIRISKNSAAGFFNDEWIKIDDIHKALTKSHKGDSLTSFLLAGLFKGRSSNSPAFLMAALTHERLLRVLKGKSRGHELLDSEGFNIKMDKLVAAKAKPKRATATARKKAVTKKAPSRKAVIKKRSVAKKKQTKSL